MSGITSSTALWYASRSTGVVAFVLLTAVVVLGIVVNRHGRLPGLPRFAVTGLHRSISLLAVTFLAVHVLTAVADSYVTIQLIAAVVPFTSSYQPLAIGLGAVSLDLMAALIITSLLRARIGRRLWRGVHWLAYAAYPAAVLHSVASAKDLRSGVLLGVTAGCLLSVAVAVGYRLAVRSRRQRQLGQAAMLNSHDYQARQRPGGSWRAAPDTGHTWDQASARAPATAGMARKDTDR